MITVLIVDDSSFMRVSLKQILEADSSIDVIDVANDGEEAIQKVKQLHPDVVLLDVEMPVLDGLTALAHIMAECPTPVLMLSALSRKDAAIALKSLDYGAVDFIAKPSGFISFDIEKISQELIAKVKVASSVNVRRIDLALPKESYQPQRPRPALQKEIVIIGASTGGPRAVVRILSSLPREISTAILVVQHMYPDFVPLFVERLEWECTLDISLAQNGDALASGKVLVAPGGCNSTVEPNGEGKRIHVNRIESPKLALPSIDLAMESAAKAYGERTLGVLLTGMGSDGAKGLKAIKDVGGSTIAEDESSCLVFGMPRVAIEMGCVDEVVPLTKIAPTILRML